MKNKSIIIICTLVILGIATIMSGTVGAKSLYTIASISPDPSPVEAYDIQQEIPKYLPLFVMQEELFQKGGKLIYLKQKIAKL